MKKRIKWIDTARFLGIFAIYLGHFGNASGKSFEFVFQFHVALFFLISGCMSNYDKEKSIVKFIKKDFQKIMIPFFGFSIISILLYALLSNGTLNKIIDLFIVILKGDIRNTFFAESLWFLSCLFLMEVIFKVLKKLDNKLLIFLICLIMFVIAEGFISPRPLVEPHWLYNLDSVFYYIIYYAIGYIIYPWIVELFKLNSQKKKVIFMIGAIISSTYAILFFFEKDYLTKVIKMIPVIRILSPIFKSSLLIWFHLILAKVFEKVDLFNEIGTNTLYLCCNEVIIKSLVEAFLGILGLSLNFGSPFHVYVYTMILLVFAVKYFLPIEKKFIHSVGLSCKGMLKRN